MKKHSPTEQYLFDSPGRLKKGAMEIAKRLGITEDEARKAARTIRNLLNGKEENTQQTEPSSITDVGTNTKKVDNENGTLESSVITTFEPKDDIELAKLHNVDLTKYKIVLYWSKLKPNGHFNSSILCKLRTIEDITGDEVLNVIKSYTPKNTFQKITPTTNLNYKNRSMLFVDLTDFHLDKRDIYGTTIEEKEQEYHNTLHEIVTKAHHSNNLDEITFVIGSDFLHTDTYFGTTTKGTQQSINTTWEKSFEIAFRIYADSILFLKKYCNSLKVVLVAGNHSYTKEYYLAFGLMQKFQDLEGVQFDISPDYRKCVVYKNNFIGLHHGNCVQDKLPLKFAKEFSQQWGQCTNHMVITGDRHHSLEKDIDGVIVKQLPALTKADEWHNKSNYHLAEKAAVGIIFDEQKGQVMNIIVK